MVMTTEVLRNMLYAGSRTLLGLGLRRHGRGALPRRPHARCRLGGGHHPPPGVGDPGVAVGDRLQRRGVRRVARATVRGETTTILEEKRPVPLFQHVMVGTPAARPLRLLRRRRQRPASSRRGRRSTGSCSRIARDDWAQQATRLEARPARPARAGRGPPGKATARGRQRPAGVDPEPGGRRRAPGPRRACSRRSCSSSAAPAATRRCQQCLEANVRLTTAEERDEIFARVEEARCAHLPSEDLHVLGYHEFLDGLTRGIAAHHAGMLPAFKEVRRGAVPARPDQGRLRHRDPRAGHQHAGAHGRHREAVEVERREARRPDAGGVHPAHRPRRAPRARHRGPRGRAVAAGHGPAARSPGSPPRAPIRSARPSGRPTTWPSTSCTSSAGSAPRELLEQSFAQFQADKAVVGLARQLRKSEDALEGYADAATCERGDFMEYAGLRRRISEVEKGAGAGPQGRQAGGRPVAEAAATGRRDPGAGRQVRRPRGRRGPRSGRRRAAAAGGDAERKQARRLHGCDFPTRSSPSRGCGCPRPSTGATRSSGATSPPPCCAPRTASTRPTGGRVATTAAAPAARPPRWRRCARSCGPTPATTARTARTTRGGPSATSSWSRTRRPCERRVEQRTNTVARQFDRVCDVLTALGLPRRRPRDRGRRAPAPALRRAGPARRRGAARGRVGRARPGPSWRRRCRCWSSSPGGPRTPPVAARARRRGGGRDPEHRTRLGPAWTPSSATTSSTCCASPTSGSRGRPGAGPRATTSTTCSVSASWRPATSCARSSSWSTCAARSPTRRATPRSARPRATPGAPCGAGWSPTRR